MRYYSCWPQSQTRLQAILLLVGVIVIACVAYLPTLAPTIAWRNGGTDSGELAAAVATLGVPHPPGYPTYVLLSWGWAGLPLGGDLAYRLNLLSALAAALAAGLSALAVLRLGRETALAGLPLIIGALLGGLWLALAPLTWSQATITEVYAPGLAMLSLSTLLLFCQRDQAQGGKQFLTGTIMGLGLGVLPQLALAVPGALVWLYWRRRPQPALHPKIRQTVRREMLLFVAGLGLGLTTFIYLPLRAVAQPMFNWGDPTSLPAFWNLVTAASYRPFIGAPGIAAWFLHLGHSLARLGQDLTWAGVGLAGLGGYTLWQFHRAALAYLLSLAGLTLLFQTNYYAVINNFVYLLPVLYSLALLAGLGAAWLLTRAARQIGQAGAILLGVGLLVALGWRGVNLAPLLDASGDQSAALFGQRTLSALPSAALVISERDETTFSLWYRQALGERPDVVVVDNRLLAYDWYQRHLRQRYPDLDPGALETGQFGASNRPIYTLTGVPGQEEVKLHLVKNVSQ